MQARELKRLDKSLESFLAKLTAGLGRSERRRWADVSVRGLLLDGERKSVEPMAARLGESDQDLHHFVSHSPWSADVLLEGLAKTTATAPPAYWIIDETSFPKAGSHSVGVQRQYCGALGKTANCQMAVSLHRAHEAAGTSQPLGWRLFLPKSWTDDPARCQRAGIPAGIDHHSKLDLALGLLDQALGWQSPPGVVLADEAYGGSFEWRLALRGRGLFYGVRVPWTTTAWQEEPRFGEPKPVRRGFRAKRGPLLSPELKTLLAIAQGLPAAAWKRVTWRQGTKGPQRARFASLPVWAAHGWKQGPQPERVEESVLIEWPADEPASTRYWLARLPTRRVALKKLVATAKARWRVEQDYRELKDELGLDHFEGRSWQGFHHHVALVTTAFVLRFRAAATALGRRAQLCLATFGQTNLGSQLPTLDSCPFATDGRMTAASESSRKPANRSREIRGLIQSVITRCKLLKPSNFCRTSCQGPTLTRSILRRQTITVRKRGRSLLTDSHRLQIKTTPPRFFHKRPQ